MQTKCREYEEEKNLGKIKTRENYRQIKKKTPQDNSKNTKNTFKIKSKHATEIPDKKKIRTNS